MKHAARRALGGLAGGAAVLLACACGTDTGNGGTDTGNGRTVVVRAGLSSSEPTSDGLPAGRDAQGTALTVTSARGNIRYLELSRATGPEDCETFDPGNSALSCKDGDLRVSGPFEANLASRTLSPDPGVVALPPGTYTRIGARFEHGSGSPQAAARGPETLFIEGTLSYPVGQVTTFELGLNVNALAEGSSEGVQVEPTGEQELLLLFDVAAWFRTAPITRCIEEGDLQIVAGHLEIEDKGNGRCKDLSAALRDAFRTSGRLEKGRP